MTLVLDESFGAPLAEDWAFSGMADDVRPLLRDMLESGATGALATLIVADGPSPRPLGAQMAISADGRSLGYVSGGCVEGSLVRLGLEAAQSGAAQRVIFGAGSPYLDVRLLCGGRIEVFVEPVRADDATMQAVVAATGQRRALVRSVQPDGAAKLEAPAPVRAAAGVRDDGVVWRRYEPVTRLVILGADPVALATASLARALGWEAALLRRKGPLGPSPIAGAAYLPLPPAEGLAALNVDPWTAIVTTTHDLEEDHEALCAALPSGAFYVGALGSRARVKDRVAKLLGAGLTPAQVGRMRAPVGLAIGAAAPFEIAVSILADVIQARRGDHGG